VTRTSTGYTVYHRVRVGNSRSGQFIENIESYTVQHRVTRWKTLVISVLSMVLEGQSLIFRIHSQIWILHPDVHFKESTFL